MATKSTDEGKSSDVKGPDGPAGDGGKTPKSRADHQYAFPPNPEPSAEAKAKADEDEKAYQELHG